MAKLEDYRPESSVDHANQQSSSLKFHQDEKQEASLVQAQDINFKDLITQSLVAEKPSTAS